MSRTSRPWIVLAAVAVALAPAVAVAAPPASAAPESARKPAAWISTVKRGEEVDVTSGAVTALSCALRARDEGLLEVVNECPFEEAAKGIVVFDVAEKQIYLLDKKQVRTSALEKAFGGGSVDFSGKVLRLEKSGVALVSVEEISVTPKPKAGSSKACL
jgi:hypothetical protein